MITIKSEREIEAMDQAGTIVAKIMEDLRTMVEPGVTTLDINDFVEQRIRKAGAVPEEIGFEGYPYASCTSTNDEICHAFPSKKKLRAGDICSVDTVLSLDGFFTDTCHTFAVGKVDEEVQRLMDVTKKCLYLGIEQAVAGNRLGDIGEAIQSYAESCGFGVVRDFVGHGIQPTMHEEPQVPHYGIAGRGKRLREGMTICIEPMITMGDWHATIDSNGWTARTVDGSWCAQYEHTLVITSQKPRILTMQNWEDGDQALGITNLEIDYNLE
ncbi:type I methionyl aminopeptidase [Aerococcus christensenii]|uniref:type I methionyl aminopeptidase n=1 Tax=Aerococcus christensenii TaxID=87541 RepID=UPI0007632A29|nr:type I methionyl aminopeptidase [Aerococcus christensenii]AMB92160.1 methionine aminopeptidase [Aerococcus christensenii]WEB70745.1 type I methionyl aminopeptidase [Aerococcus christensenii]